MKERMLEYFKACIYGMELQIYEIGKDVQKLSIIENKLKAECLRAQINITKQYIDVLEKMDENDD